MEYFKGLFLNIGLRDLIDMTIVAFAFYKIYTLVKETRAEQLIKGIIVLLVATKMSEWLRLFTTHWILQKTMTVGVIALLIVFQPELRRALEYIGRSRFFTKSFIEIKEEDITNVIEEIVEASASLSRQKIGGLIVFERETGLGEVVETGSVINGTVSSGLLINIFIPNTPLHDGAVIIRDDRIRAAGCVLPLSESMNINKELGTRHRAALGISEKSDALAIVVSEETGAISIADRGKLSRYVDIKTLRQILQNMYSSNTKKKQGLLLRWRNKNEKDRSDG
ncbi:diadenylate cyclase CdaA [Clostridium sp. D2Q-11]|uniref:Diadenylate cyclase n=1 Tax=Anaeromonas frigoriresistens TaxID=2683708 RepID=A0A942UZ59_9FIRM|nr:diadenylate cyclase CdaA [Anaeromonas frigoriresistens]MBS4538272.1 diadenylate cyclase CdaA [Anaeromonas frigoriresistens]